MAAVEEWADGALVSRVEIPDEPDPVTDARSALAGAKTLAEVRARTLALFDLLNPQDGSP
jgi:hypothetical protein